jgi:4'-phosphopantetheinyl transferase EntD
MDSEAVLTTLREMLPGCMCVAAGPAMVSHLTKRERESLGRVRESRRREFESGRLYAKSALAMLGIADAELPIGPTFAPQWPEGIVGSITHVADDRFGGFFAAAAVARTETILAVGIDVELEESLDPRTWPIVLTKHELTRILQLPAETRRAEATFLWCAKEATFKALQQGIAPFKIDIERDAIGGDFIPTIVDNAWGRVRKGFLGHTACSQGLCLATAILLRETDHC